MEYLATRNVATQLCNYVTMPPLQGYNYLCHYTATWLHECMAMWLHSLVDGYVPTCYWMQTLLVTLVVTGS